MATPGATGHGSGPAGAGPRPFVGRSGQLERLVSVLDHATAGRGGVVLLGGEPGIGKTRLAEELSVAAIEHGARVVWGRCWEAGGAPAYWPWIESLRSLVDALDGDVPLVQLMPELGGDAQAASGSPESARFELFVAVSRVLQRAAGERPLVVVLEDLHAADEPTLLLLRFVAATAAQHRMVVLGTYRDVDLSPTHPLALALPEILRAPGALREPVRGLVEDDVAQLVGSNPRLSASADLVAAIHQRTDGNPLFVQEYLRLLETEAQVDASAADGRWPVPEGVREVIGKRVDRLPEACTSLLHLASVAGREFGIDTLVRASHRSSEDVLGTLDAAIAARLVEEVHGEPGRLRFAHTVIRDTLYEGLPVGERRRRHAEVAVALEAAYGADREPYLAELAHHFFEAGPFGDQAKSVEYATSAGSRAVRALAYEEAVRLFQLALRPLQDSPDERRRCEVLVLLGDAQARAGEQARSQETFLAAARIAARLDEPELLAISALGYGGRFPWARAGNDGNLIPLLRQALDGLPDGDDEIRARLLARLAGALRDQPSMELRSSLGVEAVAMARRLGDPDTLTYALLGWWSAALMGPDELDEQLAVAVDLDELAQRSGDRELRSDATWVRYIASMTRGDVLEARRLHTVQLELADQLNQGPQHWYAGLIATVFALHDGNLDDAADLIEETLAVGREAQTWDADIARLFASFVLRRERALLDSFEDDVRQGISDHPGYRSLRCMLLIVLVEAGRIDEARALFEQLAAGEFAGFPKDNEWLFSMSLLAECAIALGDRERTEVLYARLTPYAGLFALAASEVSIGPIDRTLGVLAGALGRDIDATNHFTSAITICRRTGARPWLARSLLGFASMRAVGSSPDDRREAIELATSARDLASELGMHAVRVEAEALLAGTGVGSRSGSGGAAASLTRREREVAGLLGAGLSNRQIADRLFVSERTAETHVQNILTKLAFSSRTQVAAWAVREGLDSAT